MTGTEEQASLPHARDRCLISIKKTQLSNSVYLPGIILTRGLKYIPWSKYIPYIPFYMFISWNM